MSSHFFDTPEGGFAYELERRPGRRTLGLRVQPDGLVRVAVPMLVPHLFVQQFLRERAGWVQRKLADATALQQHKAARGFAEGDSIAYLGRDYRLGFAARSRLDEQAGILQLGLRDRGLRSAPGREAVVAALTRWYQRQARELMPERTVILGEQIGRKPAHIGIKSYRTRWGSCHPDGRIYFNWRLVMAPLEVIDYVAAHELCHLLHPNHSPAFWQAVGRLYPDYPEQRRWLRRHGKMLDL
jgi:predicted metal-dependent hydrolase